MSVSLYARLTAISGVVAMHHFHPEAKDATARFITRLMTRTDIYEEDEIAGILCECADSGLMELQEPALQFVNGMNDAAGPDVATRENVIRAFREGPKDDFLSHRQTDVYAVNAFWEEMSNKREVSRKIEEAEDPELEIEILDRWTKSLSPNQSSVPVKETDP